MGVEFVEDELFGSHEDVDEAQMGLVQLERTDGRCRSISDGVGTDEVGLPHETCNPP